MIFFIIIIVLLIFVPIYVHNMFVKLKSDINNSKALIDVYLQKRFDLIPNLVEVTKEYTKHEKELLENIALLRNSYKANKDENSIKQLNNEYFTLIGIVEDHPELKSSELFLRLQKSIIKIEGELEAARRIYNVSVTKYNTRIKTFPLNLMAKELKFKEEKLFTFEGEKSINIKM